MVKGYSFVIMNLIHTCDSVSKSVFLKEKAQNTYACVLYSHNLVVERKRGGEKEV